MSMHPAGKLRIGLAAPDYPLQGMSWGLGSYVRTISQQFLRMGHTPFVLTPGDATCLAGNDRGVAVYTFAAPHPLRRLPFPLGRGASVARARELARLCRELELDVIEAPEFGALTGFLKLFAPPTAVAVRLQTSSKLARAANGVEPSGLRQRLTFAAANWGEGRAMREADAVMTVSRATAVRTHELFGVPSIDVPVIRNPVHPQFFEHFKPAPSGGENILFVGRLEKIKGIDLLVLAFEAVLKERPAAMLRVVGVDTHTSPQNRSMKEHLRSLVSAATLARIEFLGYVEQARILELHREATLFVLPSRWESQPMACGEAMAVGTPVVVSDAPTFLETVEDGRTGLVAKGIFGSSDPAAGVSALSRAMLRLLADSALREDFRIAAHQEAENLFAPEVVARQTLEIYRQAIQDCPRR